MQYIAQNSHSFTENYISSPSFRCKFAYLNFWVTELCYFLVNVTIRKMHCIRYSCSQTLTKTGGDSLQRLDDSQTLPYLEVNSLWLQHVGRCVTWTRSSSRHTVWRLISSKRQRGCERVLNHLKPVYDLIELLRFQIQIFVLTHKTGQTHIRSMLDCVIKINDMHGGSRVNNCEITSISQFIIYIILCKHPLHLKKISVFF